MILHVPKWIIDTMVYWTKLTAPNETSGFLFGKDLYHDGALEPHLFCSEFEHLNSDRKSTASFILSDIERIYSVLKEARDSKLQLFGIFHTHPPGLQTPSGFDYQQMLFLNECGINTYKNKIWLIMTQSHFSLRGFVLNGKKRLVEILILPTSEAGSSDNSGG